MKSFPDRRLIHDLSATHFNKILLSAFIALRLFFHFSVRAEPDCCVLNVPGYPKGVFGGNKVMGDEGSFGWFLTCAGFIAAISNQ